MRQLLTFTLSLLMILTLAGCGAGTVTPPTQPKTTNAPQENPTESTEPTIEAVQTGLVAEQILSGAEGDIHYSYYLPKGYDGSRKYPLVMTMPGYDRMWFGEDSSGNNLSWNGFIAWTKLDMEMIVVSAQLSDWHEISARQAIELTEYFIHNFAVDKNRIYAAGYSAGGETMVDTLA